VLKWVERFPQIMWFGAAVLGWTAAKMIASEPAFAAWFAQAPWARLLLSVTIVGGLVAMPIWRALSPDARGQSLVIGILIVWVSLFGYIEQRWSDQFNPIDAWEWEHEIIDLVRWIGWIPLALLVHRRTRKATGAV
jgi:hypothetical protein